jgi:hypothetical protein
MNATAVPVGHVEALAGEYDHRQHAPMYWLMLAPAIGTTFLIAFLTHRPEAIAISLFVNCVLIATAFSFRWLRVVDEGTHLAARFGPLPVFRRRIAYTDIASAERDLTTIVDGWGIHCVPGRGWTFNLWGFDCVKLTLKNGSALRIGSDDAEGLTRFLRDRLRTVV